MRQDPNDHLIALSNAYAKHRGLSHWRVSYLATGNGKFFANLAAGKSCTLRTERRVLEWFVEHWPTDLRWPTGVPRPALKSIQGAA